jgi:hypothetical protein
MLHRSLRHFEIRIVDLYDPLINRCSVVNDGSISCDKDACSSCAENGIVSKPYLTAGRINVPEAQVPSGTYNIHLAVEDDHGHRSEMTQTWTIR